MKFIDDSHVVAGLRELGATIETFLHMQENAQEIVDAIARGLLQNNQADIIILYGCVNSGSGTTYTISAGAVYYQGEIYQVPAFSGTATGGDVPVLSVVTTYRSGDPVIYSDTNTFNTHGIRKMNFAFAASGSGLADFGDLNSLAKPKWTNLTLQNGWTNGGLNPPRYRINAIGQLELAGVINSNAASNPVFATLNGFALRTSCQVFRSIPDISAPAMRVLVLNYVSSSSVNLQIPGYVTGATHNHDISTAFSLDADN